MKKKSIGKRTSVIDSPTYGSVLSGVVELLNLARRAAARSVNSIMTATYWEIGRRIVEFEQGGRERAEYGKALLQRLSNDLMTRFGRGFGVDNLELFRTFYLTYPPAKVCETLSGNSESLIRVSANALTDAECAVITALTRYAFFTGSGYHTTQGMGMTIGE